MCSGTFAVLQQLLSNTEMFPIVTFPMLNFCNGHCILVLSNKLFSSPLTQIIYELYNTVTQAYAYPLRKVST